MITYFIVNHENSSKPYLIKFLSNLVLLNIFLKSLKHLYIYILNIEKDKNHLDMKRSKQ